MAMGPERGYLNTARTDVGQIDVGLRRYMLSVYNYMAGGLAVTGVIALLIASSQSLQMAIWGSPLRYVASRRIERAKTLLAGDGSITQVGVAVGFGETSAFTTAFRRHTGLTPTAFRRGLE